MQNVAFVLAVVWLGRKNFGVMGLSRARSQTGLWVLKYKSPVGDQTPYSSAGGNQVCWIKAFSQLKTKSTVI